MVRAWSNYPVRKSWRIWAWSAWWRDGLDILEKTWQKPASAYWRLEEEAKLFSLGIMVVSWSRESFNWTQGQKKISEDNWHFIRLFREAMESLFCQFLKTWLDKALNNVAWIQCQIWAGDKDLPKWFPTWMFLYLNSESVRKQETDFS